MNNQKPEAAARGDGNTLDFHSMFFTLQGEGPFSGHRSIFVRLAGCNLQCPGCDTEYTQGRSHISIRTLADAVSDMAIEHKADKPLVVITGGEPLRQRIGKFVQLLGHRGFRVQIESNGVFAPDPDLIQALCTDGMTDLIVSPKTSRVHPETVDMAMAFKYVLDHRSVSPVDGLPIQALWHKASTGVARPPWRSRIPVYVNPYDAGDPVENRLNLEAAAQSCMKHGYILGVQLHKLVGLE